MRGPRYSHVTRFILLLNRDDFNLFAMFSLSTPFICLPAFSYNAVPAASLHIHYATRQIKTINELFIQIGGLSLLRNKSAALPK
jgi:hypothetical protein